MWQAERLRGSPVSLFRNDARSRDEEEAGEEEEDMIYQLMANEFYAGRTCTLTPSRVVKRSTMGRELEPQLRHPAEELPVSLSFSSDEPRSPYENRAGAKAPPCSTPSLAKMSWEEPVRSQ